MPNKNPNSIDLSSAGDTTRPPSSTTAEVLGSHSPQQLDVAAVRGTQLVRLAFLLDKNAQFILLGEGRTAKVYLGAMVDTDDENVDRAQNTQAQYVAIKCLLTDENEEYRQQIRARFKIEMAETAARGGPAQETFVNFFCQGRIDLQRVPPEEESEKLTSLLRKASDTLGIKPWPQTILNRVHDLSGEKLEGSFYAMQLCQGSFLDILESSDPWDEMSCYQALQWAQKNVRKVQEKKIKAVQKMVKRFLESPPESWSGYEILNAFKDTAEANGFRGRVVLELASKIAELLRNLHSSGKGDSLAHRDLKPGNILIKHALDDDRGILTPVFRLSDLGYVVERKVLEIGAQSIRLDAWRTHQVPGSQFYRAPEQWTLPVEIRMRMDSRATKEGTVFQVLSSRLDNVEQGDFLTLPTKYLEQDDGRLKTIVEVTRPIKASAGGNRRRPRRQLSLRIEEKAKGKIQHDVVAHIVKASGFHTDGFSFGAILYDLATGGKNPEHFYFYCLHRYQVDWEKSSTLTVEAIVDELQTLDDYETNESKGENASGVSDSDKRKGFFGKAIETFTGDSEHRQDTKAPIPAELVSSPASKEPTYAEYLRDERGVEIPREILLLICKCMLRGYEGCYYSSNLAGGWNADKNVDAFDLVVEDINAIIENADLPFYLPRGIPAEFESNALILLRCLGREAKPVSVVPPAAPSSLPVAPSTAESP